MQLHIGPVCLSRLWLHEELRMRCNFTPRSIAMSAEHSPDCLRLALSLSDSGYLNVSLEFETRPNLGECLNDVRLFGTSHANSSATTSLPDFQPGPVLV